MSTTSRTPRYPGRICAAVAAEDTAGAIRAARAVGTAVDVVEIRLDGMREYSISELCGHIHTPLLFTNRPRWEGGNFTGSEEERLESLLEAARHGAAYVDLELGADPQLRSRLLREIQDRSARLIISHHDFERTPGEGELTTILERQAESGAHIGKIVTMAHSPLDVLRVLHLQCEAARYDFPLIAFCMGEEGRLSRAITLLLGGFMTYVAPEAGRATAPGQLTVRELRDILAVLGKKSEPKK
ncbi:MAG: type I 3-dehydroquinate dehydratase [Desulfobulbaceae bacterium]